MSLIHYSGYLGSVFILTLYENLNPLNIDNYLCFHKWKDLRAY